MKGLKVNVDVVNMVLLVVILVLVVVNCVRREAFNNLYEDGHGMRGNKRAMWGGGSRQGSAKRGTCYDANGVEVRCTKADLTNDQHNGL